MHRTIAVALTLALATPVSAGAQDAPRRDTGADTTGMKAVTPRPTPYTPAAPLVSRAVLGSAAGLWVGFLLGADAGWGSGACPRLTGAFVVAPIGSVVGTTAGLRWGSGREVSVGRSIGASLLGMLAGAAAAALASEVTDQSFLGTTIGYSLGQGIVAALVAAPGGDAR